VGADVNAGAFVDGDTVTSELHALVTVALLASPEYTAST
jgi:hypothetical protein